MEFVQTNPQEPEFTLTVLKILLLVVFEDFGDIEKFLCYNFFFLLIFPVQ